MHKSIKTSRSGRGRCFSGNQSGAKRRRRGTLDAGLGERCEIHVDSAGANTAGRGDFLRSCRSREKRVKGFAVFKGLFHVIFFEMLKWEGFI